MLRVDTRGASVSSRPFMSAPGHAADRAKSCIDARRNRRPRPRRHSSVVSQADARPMNRPRRAVVSLEGMDVALPSACWSGSSRVAFAAQRAKLLDLLRRVLRSETPSAIADPHECVVGLQHLPHLGLPVLPGRGLGVPLDRAVERSKRRRSAERRKRRGHDREPGVRLPGILPEVVVGDDLVFLHMRELPGSARNRALPATAVPNP